AYAQLADVASGSERHWTAARDAPPVCQNAMFREAEFRKRAQRAILANY
ncbi:hypothetical protein HY477_01355, partial [Candidatus Uhrbacteria bacterium]|nr:hypothetical protein [Candidatus Uhrbacteria bacterium]